MLYLHALRMYSHTDKSSHQMNKITAILNANKTSTRLGTRPESYWSQEHCLRKLQLLDEHEIVEKSYQKSILYKITQICNEEEVCFM